MKIILDDLSHPAVVSLLSEHMTDMLGNSPKEAVHALDHDGLKQADIRFFTLWSQGAPAACGALKQLDNNCGELKAMRSSRLFRRQGYGRKLLRFLIREAQSTGLSQLYLETGNAPLFDAAKALYRSEGFEYCPAFADYQESSFSSFMKLDLTA